MEKVLNLYAGIGGNRKLWEGVEVTAVEIEPRIAEIYQDFFPDDTVIVGDAHAYLLEHFREYDFIWSSPPCPTHSRMRFLNVVKGTKIDYPDMKLYQEILLLQTWFKGSFCVENVITYYDPLIKPQKANNHYFWSNFFIPHIKSETRFIRREYEDEIKNLMDFDMAGYDLPSRFKRKLINNCVLPELGLHVFNSRKNQTNLGDF